MGKSCAIDLRVAGSSPAGQLMIYFRNVFPVLTKTLCRHSSLVPRSHIKAFVRKLLITDHWTSTCQLTVDLNETIFAAFITRLIRLPETIKLNGETPILFPQIIANYVRHPVYKSNCCSLEWVAFGILQMLSCEQLSLGISWRTTLEKKLYATSFFMW